MALQPCPSDSKFAVLAVATASWLVKNGRYKLQPYPSD